MITHKFPDTSGQIARNVFDRLDKDRDNKLSREEFIYIFEETERILKLKISEDENNIKLLEQDLCDVKEVLQEIDENFTTNPNSPDLKLKASYGRVTMTVQTLGEEVILRYMLSSDTRQLPVKQIEVVKE